MVTNAYNYKIIFSHELSLSRVFVIERKKKRYYSIYWKKGCSIYVLKLQFSVQLFHRHNIHKFFKALILHKIHCKIALPVENWTFKHMKSVEFQLKKMLMYLSSSRN